MNKFVVFAASTLIFTACNQSSNTDSTNNTDGDDSTTPNMRTLGDESEADDAVFIPKDSANKMIQSFLTSAPADSNLHSLIVDGDALRRYLSTAEGLKIRRVKMMFAHTPDYMRSGNQGKSCGYKSGALTVVLAGYDSAGNYVLHSGNRVLDNVMPCPSACPTAGSASNDLIQ